VDTPADKFAMEAPECRKSAEITRTEMSLRSNAAESYGYGGSKPATETLRNPGVGMPGHPTDGGERDGERGKAIA
jgi:hypothetical protein